MDVTDQFQQVRVLFAQDGFVTVLEKVAVAMVAEIVTDGVPGQEPPHDGGQRGGAGPEQKVEVVGNQRPGIAGGLGLNQNSSEAIEKIIPVEHRQERSSVRAIPRPMTWCSASGASIRLFRGMGACYHIQPKTNQIII